MKRITKIVAYYRVSTKRQGESGLGLEGQQAAVAAFAKRQDATIVASYVEIESGKRSDRPVLRSAWPCTIGQGYARRRQARPAGPQCRVSFGLDGVGGGFRGHRQRTREPLDDSHSGSRGGSGSQGHQRTDKNRSCGCQAPRGQARHARPGHWKGRESKRDPRKASQAAAVARQKAALDTYAFLMPTIRESRTNGQTFQQIADRLNANGHATRSGKPWSATAALRLWRMAESQG